MKPLPIALTIIGGALFLTAGLSLKANADRGRLEDQVRTQLSAIKAMGFCTTSAEFAKESEPDKSDAWWDLKQYLTAKASENYSPNTFDPRSMIFVAGQADLPTIRTYLQQSQAARIAVLSAMQQHKSLTIPESLSGGSPPFVDGQMRHAIQDFIVAAESEAMIGKQAQVMQNLNAAAYLANSLVREWTSYIGTNCWQVTIIPGALRVMEIAPTMAPEIELFLNQPNLIAEANSKKICEVYFLIALAQIQSRDSPLIDRAARPKWLQTVVHSPSIEEIWDATKDKSDGYIPKSALCLNAIHQSLSRWTPLLMKVKNGSSITKAEYDRTDEPFTGMNKDLSDVLTLGKDFDPTDMINEVSELKTLKSMIVKIVAIKRKSGAYPKALSEIVGPSDVKNVAYHNNINGFSVNSMTTDPSTAALRVRIIFPPSQRFPARTLAMYRDQLKRAREGKLDVLHPEPKKVLPKWLGGPRKPSP